MAWNQKETFMFEAALHQVFFESFKFTCLCVCVCGGESRCFGGFKKINFKLKD